MQMIMIWRATQWFVRITLGDTLVAEMPFDSFVKLPAVKYAVELAKEQADLGLPQARPQPGSPKAAAPAHE
jgi:hypothetical protein